MASDYRILSGGATYYLVNSGAGVPTAGGVATSASTTPYAIVDDDDAIFQKAPREVIYSGGAPFRIGSTPLFVGYNDVVESKMIFIAGSSSDSFIALKRQLELILNTALFSAPAVLYAKPNNATNPSYYEILSADVQETTEQHQSPLEGDYTVLCRVTWRRTPMGGLLSTGETVLNAQNFRNRFSGSPDNNVAYSTGVGDLIYEGSPLNLAITNTDATTLTNTNIFLASILSLSTTSSAQSVTTSSTSGSTAAAGATITVGTTLNPNRGIQMRMFVEMSTVNTNSDTQMLIYFGGATTTRLIYASPWLHPATNASIIDAGTIPGDIWRETGLSTMYALLNVRSRTGGSVTTSIATIHIVFYYTYCKLSGTTTLNGSSAGITYVRAMNETSNRAVLPLATPMAYATNSGAQDGQYTVAGTPPRYFSGASLMVVLQDSSTLQLDTTHTFDISATHGPLWRTLRGAN